ncbi:hypothetical protein T484DRAFT_1782364, partial [Baffinella frigidus]
MVVGGKTFSLQGMINESVLDQQLASVYKILVLHSQTLDAQKSQIETLNRKVLEIDLLAVRVTDLEAWKQGAIRRLGAIEDKAEQDRNQTDLIRERVQDKAGQDRNQTDKIRERVQANERALERLDPMDKRIAEIEKRVENVNSEFEQLRVDAQDALMLSSIDALMLSSTVSFFKTELMELQEDVTQVQQNVEASTEQLATQASKTAYMELATQASKTAYMEALESPKVDRIGALEQAARGQAKQVQVLQHNWMSNWGAHESSMQTLRDELMCHITSLESQASQDEFGNLRAASGGFGDVRVEGGGGGGVALIRLDEEEKKQIQNSLATHQRALSKLETSKADAAMIIKLLRALSKLETSKADAAMIIKLLADK